MLYMSMILCGKKANKGIPQILSVIEKVTHAGKSKHT